MRGPSTAGSMPSTRSCPEVTGDTQAIIRIVVVLPAPLGPRKPNTSPRPTLKSTPSTATRSPKRLVSRRASMSAEASASVLRAETASEVGSAAWVSIPQAYGRLRDGGGLAVGQGAEEPE